MKKLLREYVRRLGEYINNYQHSKITEAIYYLLADICY